MLHYTKLQFIFICWASLCTHSGVVQAQIADAQWPNINGGRIILESQSIDHSEDMPQISVEAERINGVRDEYLEAEGNAIIIRGDQELRGDYLFYDQVNDEVTGRTNVSIKKPGVFIQGDTFKYSPSYEAGEIEDAQYLLTDNGARGKAKKLIFEGPFRKIAINATYTSCDVSQEDVYLKTSRLNINQDKGHGTARNATVWFKGAPILYAPYLSFPLTDKRKTGLLTPSYGQSVDNGLEVKIPVYLNIAPNFDSIVTLRSMSERGNLIGTSSRYLGQTFNGDFIYDVIKDDQIFLNEDGSQESRHYYALIHKHNFSPNFSGAVNLQGISDDNYFKDFSNDAAKTSLAHLPRKASIYGNFEDWYGSVDVIHYQSLNFASAPFQVDPQINAHVNPLFSFGFESESMFQFVDFNHQELNGAKRAVIYPGLRYVYENDFLSLSPKVGYHYTNYDLDSGVTEDRSLQIYSLRGSVAFERDFNYAGVEMTQTLVPQFFALHVPFEDQTDLPVFDSALADFSLSQIYSENIFSGQDRINDADQITIGVTSKFLEYESGEEWFALTVAQRFHYDEEFVNLSASDTPRSGNRSDILMQAGGRISQSWRANSLFQYSAVLDEVISQNTWLQYSPEDGKHIYFEHRYNRDSFEQFDVTGQWPLIGQWGIAGRWNYSNDAKKLVRGVLGVEYKLGCWAFRVVADRMLNGLDKKGDDLYATSIFVQLELKDITRVGSDAIGILKQNLNRFSEN